jgi:protein-S-isoprenylcysteine O-methyltransferase Ste14
MVRGYRHGVSSAAALNAADITKVGVVIIVALVVIGALLSIVITALVWRLVILAVVVALGIFVWQQRTHVKDQINAHTCNLHATFFGFHLDVPQSVVERCHNR